MALQGHFFIKLKEQLFVYCKILGVHAPGSYACEFRVLNLVDCLFLGGYIANSLAVMTDAAHLLSDFAGFMISLFAIWLGSRQATKKMSFGWHRAGM